MTHVEAERLRSVAESFSATGRMWKGECKVVKQVGVPAFIPSGYLHLQICSTNVFCSGIKCLQASVCPQLFLNCGGVCVGTDMFKPRKCWCYIWCLGYCNFGNMTDVLGLRLHLLLLWPAFLICKCAESVVCVNVTYSFAVVLYPLNLGHASASALASDFVGRLLDWQPKFHVHNFHFRGNGFSFYSTITCMVIQGPIPQNRTSANVWEFYNPAPSDQYYSTKAKSVIPRASWYGCWGCYVVLQCFDFGDRIGGPRTIRNINILHVCNWKTSARFRPFRATVSVVAGLL